ncbi:MAG: pseudouridine synthase [Thermodesulfobacteriota bacterium]
MAQVRLQKFLADAGVCSRRHAEEAIRAGEVSVNGAVVTEMGVKVDPAADRVDYRGKPVAAAAPRLYIALNKPRGVVSSCSHPGEKVVTDLVDIPERLYPVGRLDKDSRGLILLTNDGGLHLALSHPRYDHEKEYLVTARNPLSDADLAALAGGIELEDGRTRRAKVSRISEAKFAIVLKEGRNRQIRRMVAALGNRVADILRVRVAGVRLGNLAPGAWRHLTEPEKEGLLRGASAAAAQKEKPERQRRKR